MVDPPTAPVDLKPCPRGTLGRNDRSLGREGLSDRHGEILIECRKGKDAGLAVR
jgi:hypothetical protein